MTALVYTTFTQLPLDRSKPFFLHAIAVQADADHTAFATDRPSGQLWERVAEQSEAVAS